jgi:predicted transposase YbfD/YdcC
VDLLELLIIKGCVVTIDAMGTQKEIARKIIDQKADYILALKENPKNLYEDVRDYFDTALKDKTGDFVYEEKKLTEAGHGRIETRTCYVSTDMKWLSMREEWSGLKSIGMVIRKSREGETTIIDTRYFISSLQGDANRFAKAVREHWGVESMHWNLDVTFLEDKMRLRKEYLPENLAVLKRIALNMLKQETTVNKSMQRKRNKALLNEKYLEKVIFG